MQKDLKKVYTDIPESMVYQLWNDLKVDLRDVYTYGWDLWRQPDGNFRISVAICPYAFVAGRYTCD